LALWLGFINLPLVKNLLMSSPRLAMPAIVSALTGFLFL